MQRPLSLFRSGRFAVPDRSAGLAGLVEGGASGSGEWNGGAVRLGLARWCLKCRITIYDLISTELTALQVLLMSLQYNGTTSRTVQRAPFPRAEFYGHTFAASHDEINRAMRRFLGDHRRAEQAYTQEMADLRTKMGITAEHTETPEVERSR